MEMEMSEHGGKKIMSQLILVKEVSINLGYSSESWHLF